jgi:PAS domain S-box-containing protein
MEDVLGKSPTAFVVLDRDLRVAWANDAVGTFFGIPARELIGRYKPRLVREHLQHVFSDPEGFAGRVLRAYETNSYDEAFDCHVLPGPGREERWLHHWSHPIDTGPAAGGRVEQYVDVTPRKRAEETLRELGARVDRLLAESEAARQVAEAAERQLHTAFEQAPALVAVTEGPEHRFVLANAGFEAIVGRGGLAGRTVREALPELEAQGIFALFDRVYAAGEPYVASEMRILLPRDGAPPYEGWYNFVYQPLVDAAGRVTGILQHVVEVTAQVRARLEVEEARRAAETRAATLSAILESIPDGLYVGTLEGITAANRPALEQLGFRSLVELNRAVPTLADEIRTRDPATGRRLTPEEEPFARALIHGERVVRDVLVRHRGTGEDRVVRCAAAPVRVDGEVAAAVAVNTDVTELRRAGEERERLLAEAETAREEAERANRAKSEFLAVMSHELRTPLNAISGYADIIEMGIHGPVTEAQRQALGRIQKSQQHLLGLINEVLNYARLESGAVAYDIGDVCVREVLATAEALTAPQARARDLTLSLCDLAADLAVRADPEKLRQVLLNLLSNAIKFTDPGGHIDVDCRAGEDRVHLRVRDTGIGIPADRQESVFEPFVQVRADLTRTAEGTGLGLAISRDLARGMGGELTLESTPGEGSTFTLTLPAADGR